MTGISFPVIVCFKELVYMVMKFVRSCILRHLLLKISEHYILSQFTPYLPLPQDLNINFLQCLSHFFSIENLAFWTNNISAFKSFLLLITLQMLIQFEEEICFGYTGSEWIKEKLNTFEISIFLDWSFIKRKQLCNVLERRMVFLWSWCWLGLESGKCKWWLWFDFFYLNICKLPQEVCMLEFFSLCVFFCCCCRLFFNMFVWCSASVWKLS